MKILFRIGVLGTALLLGGCGVEGLLNLYGGSQYTQPVSIIRGTVALADPVLKVVDVSGAEVPVFEQSFSGGQYEIQLISGNYSGLRVVATQGEAFLQAFVPELKIESAVEGVNLDARSTATVMLVQGMAGEEERSLSRLSDDVLCIVGKKIAPTFEAPGAPRTILQVVERVLDKADETLAGTTSFVFQDVVVTPGPTVVESGLNPGWVARTLFDYDASGSFNQNTAAFDAVFVEALNALDLSAPPNANSVRTVFTVNFNEGQLSASCNALNRFRWTRDEPGRQMYFVGGIHTTSPVQDPNVDALLGNRGGWTPNQIAMYDDGTHGDEVADDNIWSVTFDLPRGVRIGYKYTWGRQGDPWTGTEEWPGNQRILEVLDKNADGYVYRSDDFADEAANKDLANSHPRAGGSLDWNEDVNGDGFPEAGEVPVDVNNDCELDGFVTPDWVPALTIRCEEFVP